MNKVCLALILTTGLLTGCQSVIDAGKPKPDDPSFAPALPEEHPTEIIPTGSIFANAGVSSIYSDIKAHKVGDLITVTLDESTSAKKQAKTQLKKDSGLSISPVTLLGQSLHLGKFTPETSINSGNDFDGSSAANQSNSLKGNISVSVVQVLPNGNLMVRGEKWLMLNKGNEYIRVTGVLRPEDINSDNTVSSQRIANARIQYGGTGDFSNTQERGWLAKFFNSVFNPF